ncbi:hypothetical protein EJ074_08510 [Mesorhizobium sp. M3A.F.Ca.ET.080.04.2.1]|uniref:hypothetical protein n=1 Tax=Mesorhizobium sp. M3A.F.Ca.ET.080.04.2.1 TaxID=2493676 RepID=UPI000F7543FA|nr:hypothetical protein [Mesorhizobium sp. M3A.F.Ca.ET.080.04.2.1]AZO09150.1 hypothetical protein EJ074_08510 [Mesorhizobium sp. M3A.F.Ca.ET.080.04.2.1]RWF26135.1 MAG: hypothetical protein EOS64_02200 [Mesorhizobium sp.]TGT61380.1 hypothetical protein EN813_020895 [Mesorhizobium sp. M00.F.Ca.ET.170.01.1.1]
MFLFKRNFTQRGMQNFSAQAKKSLLGITCVGKQDGGGAQVHAVMSALLFSRVTGIPYFHSPFRRVEHGRDAEAFAAEWEAAFNLGFSKPCVPHGVPTISAGAFNKEYRGVPAVVAEQHFHNFAERHLGMYPALAEELRARLLLPQRTFERPTIAVHIRRGDVVGNPAAAQRLTSNATALDNIKRVLADRPGHRVVVFSQGEPSDFGMLAEFCEFELNSDIFATVSGMIAADCLIMAKSSLSYVAGLLSKGAVYYEPFWHGPIPSWHVLPRAGAAHARSPVSFAAPALTAWRLRSRRSKPWD